jgi:hypothetical protein
MIKINIKEIAGRFFLLGLIMFFSVVFRRTSPESGYILWAPDYVIFIITFIGMFTGMTVWGMRHLRNWEYSIILIGTNVIAGLICALLFYLYN